LRRHPLVNFGAGERYSASVAIEAIMLSRLAFQLASAQLA
jgi:hypothetical protein